MWICTNGGLANYNNGGFKLITTLDEKSDGLTGLYGTTSISKSRDGIYFIGGEGIRMYDPTSLRTITSSAGMPVPDNWTSGITDLLLDKDGSLWAASLWNGIYKINGEIITKNYNKQNSNLPGTGTVNLAFAQDGSLWSSHGGNGNPSEDIPRYIKLESLGHIQLDSLFTECFNLSEINEAMSQMQNGQLTGRALIKMG